MWWRFHLLRLEKSGRKLILILSEKFRHMPTRFLRMKNILFATGLIIFTVLPVAAQESFDLGEITISANFNPIEKSRSGSSIEILDNGSLYSSSNLTMADRIEQLPGLSTTQSGPAGTVADLRIRGSRERYTAVYMDGIKVNDMTVTSGQYGNFGSLGLGGLNRIEILKGSQSALYGGSAVAGVVNLYSLPNDDALEGYSQTANIMLGSYDTLSTSYGLTQKTGPLTLSLGLSHLQSHGFSASEENDGNSEADAMRETRTTFGATYQINSDVNLGINGFATQGQADFDEYAATPVDGTYDETGTRKTNGIRLYSTIDKFGWSHDIALSYFGIERTSISPTVGQETLENWGSPFSSVFNGERLRLEYSATRRIFESIRLSIGADSQQEEARYDNLTDGRETVTTSGFFAEALFTPLKTLDVTATIRGDNHSRFGTETTGRVAFALRPTSGFNLRGAIATGYRAPSIDELLGQYPGAFAFSGNPNLKPETSLTYELGADYWSPAGWEASATIFNSNIDELITYQYASPTSSLINVSGKSLRRGLEIGGRAKIFNILELFGSYTKTEANDANGAQLRRVPTDDLMVGFSADLSDRLTTKLSATSISGRANDSGVKMADYTLISANINYAFNDTKDIYFRIENLLDEQYQTAAGYGTSDRAFYIGFRASY